MCGREEAGRDSLGEKRGKNIQAGLPYLGFNLLRSLPDPPMGEWIRRWSRAGQEEDVVTADLSPEVILSNNQLLLGWKAGSFLKGTMF